MPLALGSSTSLEKKRRCTVNLVGDAVHATERHNVATISVEEQLLKGRQWAREAGKAEVIAALKSAAMPWDERYRFTYWGAGITSTFTGSATKAGIGNSTEVPFTEYAEGLAKYATEEINPKRDGLVVAHGLSRNGGSGDAECESRTAFFADADEVGGSEEILAALKEAGLAFVMQDSGGSTPLRPRWHLEIPLAVPLVPGEDLQRWKKDAYRPQYIWVLGVFSELAGLSSNEGFDVSTTRLLQPVYPGCRRTPEASIPSTTWASGLALNWDELLSLTGYEAPPPSAKPKKVASTTACTPAMKIDGHCLALVRAFEVDGLVIHHREGKTVVRCPTEAKHTTGVTGDTSTVILHGSREGTFHCSHGHCRRSAAQTEALLSPKARAVLLESRAEAGVRRLQAQLAEQQQVKVKVVTLDEVGTEIARVIKAWTPGKLVVLIVTVGGGKTLASILALVEKGSGIYSAPTHRLADEVEEAFMRKGAAVQRRRGVLRAVDGAGVPLCSRYPVAAEIQKSGGSVPMLLCARCPEKAGCKARVPKGGDGGVAIVPHAMLPAARKNRPKLVTIIDESPALMEEVELSRAQLMEAKLLLDGEFLFETFEPGYTKAMQVLIGVLLAMKGGTVSPVDAASAYTYSAEGRLALDTALNHLARPLISGDQPKVDGVLNHVLALVKEYAKASTEGVRAASTGKPLADADTNDSEVIRVSRGLKLLKPLRGFAKRVVDEGLTAFRWREGKLVIKVRSTVADDIASHGGILLDATPDLAELRALRPDLEVVHLSVADGALVRRQAIYKARASRKQLLRNRKPVWELVTPWLKEALDRARQAGVTRLLLVTYLPIAQGLESGTGPCAAAIQAWKNEGRELGIGHYGGLLGLNQWKNFDGCATIGDPWGSKPVVEERAEELGEDPEVAQRTFAARELEQAHGRLRAPTRSAPAHLWHFGTVAPLGWTETSAEVVTTKAGRTATGRATEATEITALVGTLGGAKVAGELGLAQLLIRRPV